MRPSSPAGLDKPTMPLPVEIREIGKELQLAGLELCRETSTKKRHNWNDFEIVAKCKDTPIRRCGGNQRQSAGQRRARVAMTSPTDWRQIDNAKIRGHPTSMGNRIRWRAWVGRDRPFPR